MAGGLSARSWASIPAIANDNLELDDGTLLPLIDDAIVDVDVSGGRVVVVRGFIG